MKVRLYRNLKIRDKRAWSIMAQEGPRKGKVIDIVSGAVIEDATFRVSEAGRQRVLREKSKNVHAFVEGRLVSSTPLTSTRTPARKLGMAPITYDPYRFSQFQRLDCGESIRTSPRVVIDDKGVAAVAGPCGVLQGLRGRRSTSRDARACSLSWDCSARRR